MAPLRPVGSPPPRSHTLAWASILIAIGVTQAVRIVLVDASIFFAAAVLVVLDGCRAAPPTGRSCPRFSGRVVSILVTLLYSALVLAPRHGAALTAILGLVGVAVLVLAWAPRTSAGDEYDERAMTRSMAWWAGLVAAIGLWELASFVWGFGGETSAFNHPTVSDLLDSALDTLPGRVVFATMWLALGTVVVRPRRDDVGPDRGYLVRSTGGKGE
jgi:hypothetical protein